MEPALSLADLSPTEFLAPFTLEDRFALAMKLAGRRITSHEAAYSWLNWLTKHSSGLSSDDIELVVREALLLSPSQPLVEQMYAGLMRPAQELPATTVVYMVTSCDKYLPQARVLQASLEVKGQLACIVVGSPTVRVKQWNGPICTLPVPDDYEHLPLKVALGVNAVTQRLGRVSIVKMDDDCSLRPDFSPELMAEMALTFDYVGELASNENMCRFWHHGKTSIPMGVYSRRNHGEWARGGCYLLSPRASALISKEVCLFPSEFGDEYYEDKAVGDFLRRHGISVHPIDPANWGVEVSSAERLTFAADVEPDGS